MIAFAKRLKELRQENNYTQNAVALKLGIRQQSYARYETGSGEPNLETLIALAKMFNVSVDYLLGISDY
ncbi:MAG: helix-turn-helix transcriptional regulator [Clostridia bacterium]|nr:helix-turn-helix transcriptional regulator [Clostridia bacterium]